MFWWTALGALLVATVAGAQDAGSGGDTDSLFEEAQRYHVGEGRPLDARKAVELYWQVIQKDPHHADAYYNLAKLCFDQKRYDLAEKYYTQVVRLRPEDGHAYNNLGVVYEKQGKKKQARRLYEKAIRVDSRVTMAYYNLSRFLLDEGETEAAVAAIQKALDREPDHPGYRAQLARIQGEKGKISNVTTWLVIGGFTSVLVGYYWLRNRRRA